MKKTRKCSECGGTEIYTTRTPCAGRGINLLPRIGGTIIPPFIEIYICGTCGHHQMFVPRQHLAEIAQKYEKHT